MVNLNKTSLVEISVPVNGVPDVLTYSVPFILQSSKLVGKQVVVSVGNRKVIGVVVNDHNIEMRKGIKLKLIDSIFDDSFCLTKEQLDLCRFISTYYFAPLGLTLRLCLPADTPLKLAKNFDIETVKKSRKIKKKQSEIVVDFKPVTLNEEQKSAVSAILSAKENAFLLQGVTGSGKTEVYIASSKAVLLQNKSVLVIVPEIALTPQLVNRFAEQLQMPLAVLHSGISKKKRSQVFKDLLAKKVRIVIGARSALFAPMHDLGLIVVDEEHDSSLKQDENPRYHARDVALWRAQNENAKIILGSATPSLESMLNVEKQKLKLLMLTRRIGAEGEMPEVEIIDLKARQEHQQHRKMDYAHSKGQLLCILSNPLKLAIEKTLASKKQVMLFLNRRGYASFALCEDCGSILKCHNCSVSLTYHQKSNLLRCHQCNETRSYCSACPTCHVGNMLYFGLGTERVAEEVMLNFPDAKVARLDRDIARNHTKVKNILSDMSNGITDILIGTQMIAKGHDFKNVALVGVIFADTALAMPDFRSSEKTFQLLTQIAGRAGRGVDVGKVIVQTFSPDHPAIVFAQKHDVEGFSQWESQNRREALQPPFLRGAMIRLDSVSESGVEQGAYMLKQYIERVMTHFKWTEQVLVLGPAPAAMLRLRGRTRWQIFLRSYTTEIRSHLLNSIKNDSSVQQNLKLLKVRMSFDVDPIFLQ